MYTEASAERLAQIKEMVKSNPMEAKKQLAMEIVRRYHGDRIAVEEREWFDNVFSKNQIPESIPEVEFDEKELPAVHIVEKYFGDKKTKSEIRRLFVQGGVRKNNEKIMNPMDKIELANGDVFQIGKQTWFRVNLA